MIKLIIVFLVAFCMGWFLGFGCGDTSSDWRSHKEIREDYIKMLKEKRDLRRQYNEWIPINEELPEDGDAFITFDGYAYGCHDFKNTNYHPSNLQINKILTEDNVIVWMPIPEYKNK